MNRLKPSKQCRCDDAHFTYMNIPLFGKNGAYRGEWVKCIICRNVWIEAMQVQRKDGHQDMWIRKAKGTISSVEMYSAVTVHTFEAAPEPEADHATEDKEVNPDARPILPS